MNIHTLVQGTPEWKAYRASHFNASDAPAMMGCSPYKTRAQLLREMHTGLAPDVDAGTQKRFDNGHRLEALARPLAEEFIGAELYPVTGSEGRYSASFDGLTMDESTAYEHKSLNQELRECMEGEDESSRLPLHYRVQMEHQLMVSGAQRVLFMASNWTAEGELIEERHCWYGSDPYLRQQIIDGWAQFERDLAAYVLPESPDAAPVGKAPETLPALRIEVTGAVTASNLAEFKQTALNAIRSVNRTLVTDQDFADAAKAIEWCSDVESRIEAAKEHALSQTASIDALFKALDDITAESRRVRLDLDKLVTRRKQEVREEAITRARAALDAHIATLNAEIAPMRIQAIAADFAGTIKGKRSISSMQDALDGLLATTKIAAEAEARVIRANLAAFQAKAAGHELLFSDLSTLVHKPEADFCTLVDARISLHKANEARKEAERQAAEAARIAAAQAEADRARRAAEAQAEAAAAVGVVASPGQYPPPAPPPAAQPLAEQCGISFAQTRLKEVPPVRTEAATLKLGTICERLGFTMTAAFVQEMLGVKPAKVEGAAKLYREGDFLAICRELRMHIAKVAEGVPA